MADRPDITHSLPGPGKGPTLELPLLRVVLREAGGKRAEVPLGLPAVTVGTAADCDLVCADERVSRHHCRLWLPSSDRIVIRDLGSKNGTSVGGVRIVEALLPVGVSATLGSSVLRVELEGGVRHVALSSEGRFGDAIGTSPAMRAAFAALAAAASTDEPLLIRGESGTGKEVLARSVHAASARTAGPLVVFDCGASAHPGAAEAELYGCAAGALPGVTGDRPGLLEQAHGGTLVLDDVGELPLDVQPLLLRALEEKQVHPLGSPARRPADFRLISTALADLRPLVREGRLREDLYFRLAGLEVTVPPLRERREDLAALADLFLSELVPPRRLADLPAGTLRLLEGHDWPGNARELKRTVRRLALFPDLGESAIDALSAREPRATVEDLPLKEAREAVLAAFEKKYLEHQLQKHGGNVSAAARAMGVSRQFAHKLLARHGLRGAE
ncbi:MAG TPA: sigma 54-interacting transcriptional regulator [Myxococcaceae bacterium]|jgi:DNA-binding NtrC family response regulator